MLDYIKDWLVVGLLALDFALVFVTFGIYRGLVVRYIATKQLKELEECMRSREQ